VDDWFCRILGFEERTPSQVRENLVLDGTRLHSVVNDATFECGRLEIVSLHDLRERVASHRTSGGRLRLSDLVGDARALHVDPGSAGALFQVASQFNLLEMVSPNVTPEQGIAIYSNDPTQGPACAIACGAGTIFRNYFVRLDEQIGQTANMQVDCLAAIGDALGNSNGHLWAMRNGYALPSAKGLDEIDEMLASMSNDELDTLRSKLMIGVQWETQVTLDRCEHLVTQAYCSAMPVSSSGLPRQAWQRMARLVLEAAYEATLAAALLNASRTGSNVVYLTLLGGGAFGNDRDWILDAIRRACKLFHASDLDVKIVCFRSSNSDIRNMVDAFSGETH
jgi:hypothetical protein